MYRENVQAVTASSWDTACDEEQSYTHKHHYVTKSSASCAHARLLTHTYTALHHIYQSQKVLVYSHSWEGSPPWDFIQDVFNLVTALPTAVFPTHVEGENQRQVTFLRELTLFSKALPSLDNFQVASIQEEKADSFGCYNAKKVFHIFWEL